MPGMTNRGKYAILGTYFRADTTLTPGGFSAQLITNAVVPGPGTDLVSELTEIAAGNGYAAGGISLGRNATDFDVLTEDDVNNWALVQIRDLVWTAAGGPIPASGSGASYVILGDDDATPNVVGYASLGGSPITVSDGQSLTLQNTEFRLTEV